MNRKNIEIRGFGNGKWLCPQCKFTTVGSPICSCGLSYFISCKPGVPAEIIFYYAGKLHHRSEDKMFVGNVFGVFFITEGEIGTKAANRNGFLEEHISYYPGDFFPAPDPRKL